MNLCLLCYKLSTGLQQKKFLHLAGSTQWIYLEWEQQYVVDINKAAEGCVTQIKHNELDRGKQQISLCGFVTTKAAPSILHSHVCNIKIYIRAVLSVTLEQITLDNTVLKWRFT